MTVFPIHIIELLTLALVLLGAYRVFQAQAFENESQIELNMREVPHPRSLKNPTPASAPTEEPEIQHQQALLNEQNKMPEHKPVCHQTALNSYIGDFF